MAVRHYSYQQALRSLTDRATNSVEQVVATDSTAASAPMFVLPAGLDAAHLALIGVRVLILIIGTFFVIRIIDKLAVR